MIPVLPVMLSAVMTFYLLNSRRLLFLPGMAPWFLFTLWVGATVVNVHGAGIWPDLPCAPWISCWPR